MGSNPVNLAVRFLLELVGLGAIGWWGWHQGTGAHRYALAIGLPAVAAVLWGALAVPEDPSRSGRAPVQISGVARLALEVAFFTSAIWSLFATGSIALSCIYGIIAIIHHAVSYDRILWLIRQ